MRDLTLSYELTLDDLVALSRHHYISSPTVKRQLLILRLFVVGIIMATAVALDDSVPHHLSLVIAALACAIALVMLPKTQYKALEKTATRQFAEGKNRSVLGNKQLTVTDTRLLIDGDLDSHQLAYAAIERVARTNDHTFIYVGALSAHIIPHRDVAADQIDALHDRLAACIDGPTIVVDTPDKQPPAQPPSMHHAMTAFFHNRDTPCPTCDYNLRGQTNSTCPECGTTLQLTVETQQPPRPQKPWLATIIITTFLSGGQLMLAFLIVLFNAPPDPYFGLMAISLPVLAIVFSFASPLIIAGLLYWRDRFSSFAPTDRWCYSLIIIVVQLLAIFILLEGII